MKKVLYVFLGLIALLIIVAVSIPFIYKDEIRAKIDKEIAKSVNADVYYDAQQFNLSLIRNFPNISVSLGNFGIVGRDEFKGDTLTSIKSFEVVVNLMSVIRGEQIQVNRIFLDEPRIMAKVLSDGKANWDIFIEDTTKVDTTEAAEFSLAVKDWQIQNGFITYLDNTMPMFARIAGLNHQGSGDFTQDIFDMTTNTSIDALSVEYDSVMYLSNKKLAADVNLNMNMPESRYTFQDNTIRLNNFAFGFDGWLAMPDTNNITMDLNYHARETKFKNILSLVPGVFKEDFEDIQTDGTLAFDGFAKGTYNENKIPAFGLNLKVDNGMFKYPKLPNAVTNIVLDMAVDNKQGILDSTIVNIRKFHMDMGKNPVDARLLVKGLTNYEVDANVVARLNLAELTSAFPLEDMTLRGLFSLNLDAKGVYSDSLKLLPAIKANMSMIDGYVKTVDFPSAVENINFNAAVNNETGQMKDARVHVPNFNMTMDGEPFEAVAYIENLDDYNYDVKLKGIIDLAKMTKIYPLEDMTVTGRINADIHTKGRMSDVEAERYERLPTSGTMNVKDFTFVSKDMPQGARITNADMNFNPRNIQLTSYEGFLGKSPVSMTGSVSNYIGYLFKEGQTIKGNLNFNSPRFNVNEWMTDDTTATEEPAEVLEIPKDVDFVLVSAIDEVIYDNMTLSNLKGTIVLKEGTARMDKVNFNTLGGSIGMNGLYDSRNLAEPKFDFDLNMQNLAISEAYKTFNTIQALAPIAQKMNGEFSTNFKLSGLLSKEMTPVYNTLTGGGIIKIAQASVSNLEAFGKINSLVKTNLPTDLELRDVLIKAQVIDGKAVFEPFDLKVGNNKMTIGGSNSFDGGIDYVTNLTVPAGAVGEAFNNALANLTGTAPTGSQNIKLNLGIGGTYSDPKVNLLSSANAGGGVATTAKETVKEAVQNRVDDAKERVQAKADSAKQEAEARARAEADRAKQEAEAKAREEADRLKKEAENKAKQEAEKLKKKLGFPQ